MVKLTYYLGTFLQADLHSYRLTVTFHQYRKYVPLIPHKKLCIFWHVWGSDLVSITKDSSNCHGLTVVYAGEISVIRGGLSDGRHHANGADLGKNSRTARAELPEIFISLRRKYRKLYSSCCRSNKYVPEHHLQSFIKITWLQSRSAAWLKWTASIEQKFYRYIHHN